MNRLSFPTVFFSISIIVIAILVSCSGSFGGKDQAQPGVEYERSDESNRMVEQSFSNDGDIKKQDASSGYIDKKADVSNSKDRLMENEANVQATTKVETDEAKKHVYFGYMSLVVNSLSDARNAIGKLAEDSGGYIESSYDTQVIIRIPKDKFNEIFTALLSLGEVEKKTIETYDVTEYFQDLEMRLSVAQRTRARLYSLLERTQDVQERLKILKEIKRLSEEIENTKLQLETVKRLIAFSSITIDLGQRLADVSSENKNTIPFKWIAGLDPFYPGIRVLGHGITFSLGDGFAVFDDKGYFFAESPEGIRVRVGTTDNRPSGDTRFWQKALMHYLGNLYKTAIASDMGDSVKCILFTSRDSKPYSYLVGLFAKGDTIFVVEAFFPNAESYDAKHASVEKAVKEMKFK